MNKVQRSSLIHQGKANDVYQTTESTILEISSSDRVSAGNGKKKSVIPGKGKANNLISTAIFQRLEEAGVSTHYYGPGSDEQSKLVLKARPIPLEVIFRFEVAGSFAETFHLAKGIKFESVFIEFTFKDDEQGDPRISEWSIVKDRIVTREQLDHIIDMTKTIAHTTRDFFAECNGRLIDGKVEFGFLPDSSIILIDEISPDTVRVVDLETGESLDKDRFRKDMADAAYGYAEMLRRVEENDKVSPKTPS